MKFQFDRTLITPSQAELLLDTLPFILNGYKASWGQARIENSELLQLARGLDEIYRLVLERSQVWVDLTADEPPAES